MKKRLLAIAVLVSALTIMMLPAAAQASVTANNPKYNRGKVTWDIVRMGHKSNGTAIEWRVLENKNGKTLLLSNEILLQTVCDSATWSSNSARSYLNSTFIENTFSQSERNALIETTLETYNDDDELVCTTNDKVFLLSREESNNPEYGFASPDARIAKFNGSYDEWTLRSKRYGSYIHYVTKKADDSDKIAYSFLDFNIRPAIWINSSAINLKAVKTVTWGESLPSNVNPETSTRFIRDGRMVAEFSWIKHEFTDDFSALRPTVTVRDGKYGYVKLPERMYNASLPYSTDIGSYTASIWGKKGAIENCQVNMTYQITKRKLTASYFELPKKCVYTGMVHGSYRTNLHDSDYTVSGTTHESKAGTYTMTFTGKGKYTGSFSKKWTIAKRNIKGEIDAQYNGMFDPDVYYNGKKQKLPNPIRISAKFESSCFYNANGENGTLVKDRDYTITYKNNKNIGTAYAIVTGKGNYCGTDTIKFDIIPKPIKIKSAKMRGGKVKIKMKKIKGIKGYQYRIKVVGHAHNIYPCVHDDWKTWKFKSKKGTVSKRVKSQGYRGYTEVQARGWYKWNGKKVWTEWSDEKIISNHW